MSERIVITPEKSSEVKFEEHELPKAPAEKAVEKDPGQTAHEARAAISETTQAETQLNPLQRLEADEKASQAPEPSHVNTELKKITLRRELQQIRRKLPAPQRALSKIVHQPVIRIVSEAAGKTVSRPSGLLGGGLVALVGTSGYLYLASHIGFRYNYGVFLLLFAGGFALGLFLELLVHLATASRRKAND